MRKFVTFVLLLFILCGCTAVKKDNSNGEIVIGSDQFEPFSYIDNGEIDCIWGCFSMDDREDLYAWVGPYLFSNQSVMVKDDSDIYSLADLKNKIVGVQATSKAEWAFENNEELSDIRYLYTFSTINEVFISLQRAYVDAVAGHELALRALIRGSDDYRFLDENVLTSKLGVAFKKDYDQSFLALLANTLHEMRNDGTIKEIVDSYTSNVMMEDGNE